MATWRPLTPADIPSLMAIADKIHSALPERPEIFAERIALYPAGCLALETTTANNNDDNVSSKPRMVGYAISHPIRRRQPPELDTLLGEIPADADAYYIHDVAVVPEARGMGYAGQAVEKLLGVAGGFEVVCLVSVYGTQGFWGRFGFKPVDMDVGDQGLRGKVEGYGGDAVYLERKGWC
ncbi:acyl-CoA N-acyltransferase [Aspergillus heterothallicus]